MLVSCKSVKTLDLTIIAISCITMVIIAPHAFADMKESAPSINEEQFQLLVNQSTSLEFDTVKVKFLDVTADSRCPSDVTCVWQGEVKIFVNIIENNRDLGDFSLTSRAGQKDLGIKVFDGHQIQVVKVDPYPTSGKKTPPSDYVASFIISKSGILSPLKQLKSGIAIKDITCNNSLQLVIKAEDGTPACVRPEAASKLILRGWASSGGTVQ
jgi:hypothetical protein